VTEAIEKADRGLLLYGPSTIFGQHAPVMPDEDTACLALRTADQLRTDIANLECGQEFLMRRVNSLPTASDLWRERLVCSRCGGRQVDMVARNEAMRRSD